MKGSWNSIGLIPFTLSLFFLFIFNFRGVFGVPTRHKCHPEHRDAILQFVNEFEILEPCFSSPYLMTKLWSNNSDCCYWDGITCDVKSGHVIELNLNSSCLHGKLSSKSMTSRLQNLRFLTTLDLSINHLSGQIPSSLENLSHLTSLSLSDNNFFGAIPSSLGNLSHLTSLSLSDNNFVGEIPSLLGNLSHLTSLDLCENNFVGEIPSSFGNLSHLTSLDLCENNFVGEIPSSFGNLSHLTYLDLSTNHLSGEIPSSLGNLLHLISLDLSENIFVGFIPSSFGSLNQLESLLVDHNNLIGNFPLTLLNLTKLSELSLSNNHFTGTLPPNISSLSNLESFYANNNAFTGALPSSLFAIPSLNVISVGYNQLNGTLEFGNTYSNLQELRLGINNFKGPISGSISKLVNLWTFELSHFNTQGLFDYSIFSHLKSLKNLYLSHLNSTTTIDLNTILSYFKSLEILDLYGCHVSATNKSSVSDPPLVLISELHLSGCGITEFPELLRTQHNMTFLDISDNKMKGQVPGWLWMLPILNYVNLSNNSFTGFETPTVPGLSFVREPFMNYLFGANNNFTGEIPSFICVLRNLIILDLSNNKFNGSILRCMGSLSLLRALNLRQNSLSGGLPDIVFESLRSLDVGHNQLKGNLPKSLIRFSRLEVLNVESNGINDMFPFWLSSLKKLQVIVLRSNAFHGPIQQTSFSKLRIIDISRNHFNGTLPSDCFVNWTTMYSLGKRKYQSNIEYMGTYVYYFDSMVLMNKGIVMEMLRISEIYTALDFSGNKFEGQIPRSIGLLKELLVLNLSNNVFTGQIPSSVANLIELESLDVSKNKLSGEIPQEVANLSYLAYMDFSHNQLVGLVPGGTQFRRQPCSSFEDNPGLYGPSLDEVCVDIHSTTSQQSDMLEPEEDVEEVMSWIAAGIGFIPGVAFGLTIGYLLVCYKKEWFMNPFLDDSSAKA